MKMLKVTRYLGILLFTAVVGLGQMNVGSGINVSVNPPPSIPQNQISASVIGNRGSRLYFYWVVVDYPVGSSLATGPVQINQAPDTLDSNNYVQINFPGLAGAISYDVLRTTTPQLPNVASNVAVVTNTTNTTVNDQSNSLTLYVPSNASEAKGSLILNNQDYLTPMFDMVSNNIKSSGGLVTYPQFGFIQNNSPSTLATNGYAYFLQLPAYNPASYNSYASYWADQGGFPASSVIGAAGNGVPQASDNFRFSSFTTGGRNNTLSVYQGVGGSSIGAVPLYAQGSAFGNVPYVYGGNAHAAGCSGFKCNGTNYIDYNVTNLIGWEVDTEIRHTSTMGIGVYSVCVNCMATGSSSAFLADANKSLGIGDPNFKPWTVAYNSSPGGALIGVHTGPVSLSGPSDAQRMENCSYIDAAETLACTVYATTQNSVTQIKTPNQQFYVLNSDGTLLSTAHFQFSASTHTSNVALANTDMGTLQLNTGATGAVNITLPQTGVAGLFVDFVITAAQTINIRAANGATIRDGIINSIVNGTLSSNSVGSTARIIAVSATQWVVQNRTGDWSIDSVQLGTANQGPVISGNATQTGIFRLKNIPVNASAEFRLKPNATATGLVNLTAPGSVPAANLNDNTASTSPGSVSAVNTLNCSSAVDANGDYPCSLMRASIPLPVKSIGGAATLGVTGVYSSLGCLAFNGNQMAVLGRGFSYKAYGTLTVLVTDTPTLQWRVQMFTDGACTTGATTIQSSSVLSATASALTGQPWDVELELINLLASGWRIGGRVTAVTNTAANPLIRHFNAGTATVFDTTACTSNVCGMQLQVQASSGGVAGAPSVNNLFQVLEYH